MADKKTNLRRFLRGRHAGVILCAMAIGIIFFAVARRQSEARDALPARSFFVMGTAFTITLPADAADYLEPAATISANLLYQCERLWSVFSQESEISRLNAAAGGSAVALSPETITLLRAGRHCSQLSGGAFDVTVAPLIKCWKLRGGEKKMPTAAEIGAARALVGWQHLQVGDAIARLELTGMAVDLGGIAKGYALDLLADSLKKHGIQNALLNLGGNILALGSAAPGKPWRIGVRDPLVPRQILGTIKLQDGEAVASSGDYERFVVIDGQRYAHIIDPRTGYPVKDMAGTTVICRGGQAGLVADALSTALFVLGVDDGLRLLRQYCPDSAALFVPNRRPLEIHLTKNFADRFAPADSITNYLHIY